MKQQLIKKLTQFAIATCLLAIPALAQFGDSVTEGVGFPQQCCWAFTTHAFWLPDPDKWSIIAGSAAVSISDGPNGTTVANLKVSAPGSLTAAYELPQVSDLRGYDSFNFVSEINNTRIGGLVLLVDSSSHRRWYQLILQAAMGWRQPVYSINNYVGEDPAFDLSRVAFIWFNQGALAPGDVISIGAISFDVGLVDHADYASNWVQDWACGGTLSTASDAAVGPASLLANVQACQTGQVDIAINAINYMGITWDWSEKSYISFYYKDTYTSVLHYFLIYDKDRHFREWLFPNNFPGRWMKVTAPLTSGYYLQSGILDLGNVIQFEVGIFGGPPNQNYTFQINEVTLYPGPN
jgi:hypothetical protein